MDPLNPEGISASERALLERARAALDVTPLSVAAAEGLNAAAVRGLLAGNGSPETAEGLARAFAVCSAGLRALAVELTEAAARG